MATLEQQRARFALEKVDSVRPNGDRAKYKTQLLKLPARLHTNGLGQTVAFYLASGAASPEARICGWLGEWMRRREIYPDNKLLDGITGKNDADAVAVERRYRAASVETRALAVWLKRFAEAFLEDRPEEGEG